MSSKKSEREKYFLNKLIERYKSVSVFQGKSCLKAGWAKRLYCYYKWDAGSNPVRRPIFSISFQLVFRIFL